MARMPRFRGHFYNWYDTRDLRALEPKYVSSVDSGNLAGHLLAVANACKEWGRSPMVAASRLAGIADTLSLTAEHAAHLRLGRRTQTVTPHQLEDSLAAMTKTLNRDTPSKETLSTQLSELAVEAATIVNIASAIALERSDGSGSDLLCWARASLTTIEAHRADHKFSAEEAASSAARLLVLESAFRAMAMAMEFGFLYEPSRQLLSIGFLISEFNSRSQLLRPSRIRGAAGQFLRHRQRRHTGPTLVPARSRRYAGRTWHGSDFLVRLHV